jgi:hypothetical protein
MCIQTFMMFVSCLVLTCWSNTGHSCQVLLNLLFIRSSCLCIGVICLFMLYALRHINMGTSCIMSSLETLSDVPFVLVQLSIWYVLWWVPTSGSWSSLLWHSSVLNSKFHISVGFQEWMLFIVWVCIFGAQSLLL